MSAPSLLIKDLNLHIRGDVLSDRVSRGIYATDASIYQIDPVVVVLPRDADDVGVAIQIARDYNCAILPRGGGTSLAGQTVGKAMILDFSKYMNQIIEFNEKERWIRVQPGIVRDELNNFLEPYGLHFAPDPATSSRANIGGMIGNNSSGTKSILYGKTVDHLLELSVLLEDGTQLELSQLTREEFRLKGNDTTREGKIYREFGQLIADHEEAILDAFPKVMRRVQGYNLDEFAGKNNWNLSRLICGSEGTLAVILEARLQLEPLPKYKSVSVVHFQTVNEAIRAVNEMLPFKPAAIEILDKTVLDMSRTNLTTARHSHFIEGNPAAILIVEFYGETVEDISLRAQLMIANLKEKEMGYAYPVYQEGDTYNDVWLIRKKGLGLMLGMKGNKKPLPFIEDASIPTKHLPEYIERVLAICKDNNTEAAMYAHASVGVIHVRPILDLRMEEDIDRFKNISAATFKLVKEYGGSWSGEHGDGLVRSFYLKEYFGDEVYGVLKKVKALFDPEGRMNPGKIIDAPPIDQHLRYGTQYQDQQLSTIYKYREDGSFANAVHMCTGVGECRKISGGTMCPSFKATRDEEHSTRGRANALRLAMSGQMNHAGLADDRLKEALDLCLSCKACKSECPSNVDMAKLKSEVMQYRFDQNGISLRDRMIRSSDKAARMSAGKLAGVVNATLAAPFVKYLLDKTAGFDRRRTLPTYSSLTFTKWYNTEYAPVSKKIGDVVLFADTYMNYHEPSVGIAATRLLQSFGYHVILGNVGCCQRPKISHGFLKDAKTRGTDVADGLDYYLSRDIQVVVCEPSCASALNDDLPDLIDNEDVAKRLNQKVRSLDLFIAELIEKRDTLPVLKCDYQELLLHGHCHQKALYGTDALKTIFGHIKGVQLKEIPSGCCGMAGSFGYEKEHYELSEKIGEEILFPVVRSMNEQTGLIANGFSCRHQISHFTNRSARHWVEVVHPVEIGS